MNRRILMGGMLASASPALVTAQSATPTAQHEPGSILRRYLNDVWIKRNADAIADFFDAESLNLQDIWREHTIALDDLDPDQPLVIRVITSDATNAMAYCGFATSDGKSYDMFVVIRVESSGLISGYRWMSEPSL